MPRRAAEAVFQGLFLFSEIRGVLRETAPLHRLSADQKAKTTKILEKLEKQISILKEELVS